MDNFQCLHHGVVHLSDVAQLSFYSFSNPGHYRKKKTSILIKAVNSHLLKLAAIKRKHNFRWQHLSQMKDSGLCSQECGVPLHDAPVTNAIMLLQACIHKSESTELFLTSLVASSH